MNILTFFVALALELVQLVVDVDKEVGEEGDDEQQPQQMEMTACMDEQDGDERKADNDVCSHDFEVFIGF